MRKTSRVILLGLIAVFLLPLFPSSFKVKAATPAVVINEIQTGGLDLNENELPAYEFVEIKNTTDQALILNNWQVQYLTGAGNPASTPLAVLNGSIEPQGHVLIAHTSYILPDNVLVDFRFGSGTTSVFGKTVGQIRIIDNSGETVDRVAWGNATVTEGWPLLPAISVGHSVKRILPGDALFETGLIYGAPTLPLTPQGGGYEPISGEEEDDDPPPEGGQGGSSELPNSCSGVVISELLPNPEGSDTGSEFIELQNLTGDVISLLDCQLSTSANSKTFIFGDVDINPSQYLAFHNDLTGLTLENSAGGTVFLVDSDDTELSEVDYPPNLEDDVSWSLIDGVWAETFSVTPNAPNILLTEKPCPSGEVRNVETNRCVNAVAEAAGLSACKSGQERNPETRRCRNISSFASALKACEPGQVRNPDTNRCRKASSSALTPCKEGQERNPETNRCRNVSSVSTDDLTDVKDVLAATTADKSSWLLAGITMVGALSYGVWEWRNELLQQFVRLKNKFSI